MPFAPPHVYVHVPFCGRRCSYCDFAIAVRGTVPVDEYIHALRGELDLRFADAVAHGWRIETLYFGGGTPSKLGGDGIARAIALVRDRATLASGAEITIEANPEDVTPGAARAWADAGVNRVSLGSQSFDDSVLAWMHRTHDAAAIPRAVATLRDAAIANISVDLIFALPPEVPRDWTRDLESALVLEPQHVSLYGLTIEPHTPLGRWHERGTVHESPEERYELEFLEAHERMTAAGFDHYEVSNFGVPGFHSRHNSAYWLGAPYAGLGPSAHEFDGTARRWNVAAYSAWLGAIAEGRDPIADSEVLSPENRVAEAVYLGLRTANGLVVRGAELPHVQPWIDAGWAKLADGERLVLTPLGWLRLDALAADLTLFRSR